jgi:hypothetical protein
VRPTLLVVDDRAGGPAWTAAGGLPAERDLPGAALARPAG